MNPVEAASVLIDERFPECLAAFVGGSVIEGRGTPTSDLDMVVITNRDEAPYRESLRYAGWCGWTTVGGVLPGRKALLRPRPLI